MILVRFWNLKFLNELAARNDRNFKFTALVSLLFFHAGGAHAPHKIAIREAP